jgi:flagellar motor switch protein FliM
MVQSSAPLTFLDHLRASAKAAPPDPAPAAGNSKQLANAVQRALLDCIGPGLEFEVGAQQLVLATDWTPSLDASACVLAQTIEDDPGQTALILFDRRTAILLATAQFGGASMLGLTDTGRPLSTIEQEYLVEFGAALLSAINSGSQRDTPVRLIDPQASAGLLPPASMLTLFDFTLTLNDVRLNFAIAAPAEVSPSETVAPVRSQADSAWKSAIGSELTRSKVRLEATVNLAPLTLSRLRVLIPGDIIPIPEGGLGRTTLVSRGEALLTGRLGKFGGSYTVRVTSIASPKPTSLQGAIANRQREKR